MGRPRKKLKSAADVSEYISGLIRRVELHKIDAAVAGKLGFLCNILLKSLEIGDFEKRLIALESRMEATPT